MTGNAYEILGIREGASIDEIKRAYHKKAKELHPDLHPNDPDANEKMQQVNEAYEMLCDPNKNRSQREHTDHAGRYYQDPGSGFRSGPYTNANEYWRNAGYTGTSYGSSSYRNKYYYSYRNGQNHANLISPIRSIFQLLGSIIILRLVFALFRVILFGFLW